MKSRLSVPPRKCHRGVAMMRTNAKQRLDFRCVASLGHEQPAPESPVSPDRLTGRAVGGGTARCRPEAENHSNGKSESLESSGTQPFPDAD